MMEPVSGCLFYLGYSFTGQFVVEMNLQVYVPRPSIHTSKTKPISELFTKAKIYIKISQIYPISTLFCHAAKQYLVIKLVLYRVREPKTNMATLKLLS